MDYPGKVITKTQVTPTQTSASGNWTLDDQAAAIKNNNWPVALVPNPISKSLRFNSADSAYLNRTPASDTSSNKKGTFSCWMKVSSNSGTNGGTFLGAADNYHYGQFYSESLYFGNSTSYINTAAVFRDFSAWYHVFFVFDTTLATANDRMQIWVNGVRQAVGSFNTQPTQNASFVFLNTAQRYDIGRRNTGNYFNGYLTEINFIDGQALTPSDFGLTNPQTGQWIPKKYTGTYGTNGFYLNFKDATSTTTLGYDYSGNANNWATTGFSVTAGAGNDSLTDVPTPWVAYNTTGDVGGVVRGNYCTLNPLNNPGGGTLSNGNLDVTTASSGTGRVVGTVAVSSGKWYWEVTPTNAATNCSIGIAGSSEFTATYPGGTATSYGYIDTNGNKYNNGSASAYGATYTTNDVIGIALDLDAGTLVFYKNGVSQGTAFSSLSGSFVPALADGGTGTSVFTCNFGQRPFAYTPPAGFRSLCTTNLSATTIGFGLTNQGDDYMNVVLWTGNNVTPRTISGLDFQPDFVWLKDRTVAHNHYLYDAVRGAGNNSELSSNLTAAEGGSGASEYGYVSAFTSNGFTLTGGTDPTYYMADVNYPGSNFVAWNWKAGGTGVTNTAGSITSTVSANTTAGFSIVTYTGTGANATVGHGLGVAPSMVIVKARSTTSGWWTWHRAFVTAGDNDFLQLNTTGAKGSGGPVNMWNSTVPTSTVFSIGSYSDINSNGSTRVAYCFAAVAGYSAFGSYTGNGSTDGPFVYLGFRPRYVMIKRTDSTSDWTVWDTARNTYNTMNLALYPDLSNAEVTTSIVIDTVSNGIKIRNSNADTNASGGTYIYAAFAESPFQFANAR